MNKYFTKEVKIALMAIVAVVLLFVGINFLKGINIFKSGNTYLVKFDNISGLAVSNAVFANGYPIGIVRNIEYDYHKSENVVVEVELDEAMRVPSGTTAELEPELMGGVKMNLKLGPNPADIIQPGDTITGGMYYGAMAQLSEMIPTVTKMLPKLDSILHNLNQITGDPALAQTVQNAAAITGNLKNTTSRLDHLMANDIPQLTARLNRIGANMVKVSGELAAIDVEATMRDINTTLANAKTFSAQLGNIATQLNTKMSSRDNTLGLMLNDRSLYDNLNHTVMSADSLMIDLKAHPKRYVHFSVFGKKDK